MDGDSLVLLSANRKRGTVRGESKHKKKKSYLDVTLTLGRDVLIESFRYFEIQYKTHTLPIGIAKEHCSGISG